MGEINIRPLKREDEARWRVLWGEYCRFYDAPVSDAVSDLTWARLNDPISAMFALVACAGRESEALGLCHCVVHPNTWSDRSVCYLEDLYVTPAARAQGVGRALIEAVHVKAVGEDWLRVYWMTRVDNAAARRLYDSIAICTDWVRYDYPV